MVNKSSKKKNNNNHLSTELTLGINKPWQIYDGNPGPGLWQAQRCDRVKMVNWIPILPLLIIGSPKAIQIKNLKKWKKT